MPPTGTDSGSNPRKILSDATLVVPSNRDRNYTVETKPDWLSCVVRTDKGRSVARNRGIREADSDWIILADDDITFPTELTASLVCSMHRKQIVGVEDFWPLEWLLTRYMVFHRSLWEGVGGFDESREHGEDTDFTIRCEKAGAEIYRLPRQIVPHHDEDGEFTSSEHTEWLSYLLRRHPRQMVPKAAMLAAQKLGIVSQREDYADL